MQPRVQTETRKQREHVFKEACEKLRVSYMESHDIF